jgi:hypothetical protein
MGSMIAFDPGLGSTKAGLNGKLCVIQYSRKCIRDFLRLVQCR